MKKLIFLIWLISLIGVFPQTDSTYNTTLTKRETQIDSAGAGLFEYVKSDSLQLGDKTAGEVDKALQYGLAIKNPEDSAHSFYKVVTDGDSLQNNIDHYYKRSVTLHIYGNLYFTQTIKMGSALALIGERATLDTQGTQYFQPRGLLDFRGAAVNGLESDPTVDYRNQSILLEELTMRGSGHNNNKIAISLHNSSANGHVGLFEMNRVYIKEWTTAVDGIDSVDGFRSIYSHLWHVKNGLLNIRQQSTIEGTMFWQFYNSENDSTGICLELSEYFNRVFNNEFSPGDGTYADKHTTCLEMYPSPSAYNMVFGNYFQEAALRYIQANSLNSIFGNTLNTRSDSVYRGIELLGNSNVTMGNILSGYYQNDIFLLQKNNVSIGNAVDGAKAITSGEAVWRVGGDSNIVAFNGLKNVTATNTIRYNSTADDNIYFGYWQTMNDGGKRNMFNGRSLNNGDPNSTGNWNGYAGEAYRLNVVVEDYSTNPSTLYMADSHGNWIKISP